MGVVPVDILRDELEKFAAGDFLVSLLLDEDWHFVHVDVVQQVLDALHPQL